jgi:dihydrofolate reductase
MRKIIFSIPITLDGYIEGPNRELDWVIADDELHDFATQLLKNADIILYGRVTYELMLHSWPTVTSTSSMPKSMIEFANALNPMSKIVYSRTLKNVEWNTKLMDTLLPEEILKMKSQEGSDIVLGGGAMIAQAFMQHNLIDEYQLLVQPVAIGIGKPLFNGIHDKLKMNLKWSQPFRSGVIALCYQPGGK